jgi:hypothetical protein
MSETIGSVTKDKFHNFVLYCSAMEGVSNESLLKLNEADRMTATCLLALFKDQLTPDIMASAKARCLKDIALVPRGLNLDQKHVDKICAYLELFHM